MARSTRKEINNHIEAVETIEHVAKGDGLPHPNHIEFVLEHYRPDLQSAADANKDHAFFTPVSLSLAFASMADTGGPDHIVDIGAGIGSLIYGLACNRGWQTDSLNITAIELNPDSVRVGNILFPWVNWVCGSIFDEGVWDQIGSYDFFVSNPPFNGQSAPSWVKHKGKTALDQPFQ